MTRNQTAKLVFISDICLFDRPDGRSGPIREIMTSIQDEGVDIILGGGDYACAFDDGRYLTPEPAVQRFFDEWQSVFSRIPFVAVYGNHECCVGEDFAMWRPRLDFGFAPYKSKNGKSFGFDLLDTYFVGFYGTGQEPSAPKEDLIWLDQSLKEARERGQKRSIVFQHGPVFSFGKSHPPQEKLRSQIVPILEHNRVNLHLSAHDLSYERTLPLLEGGDGAPKIGSREPGVYKGWPGVVYAKVSPTGRSSKQVDNVPDEIPDYMAVTDDQHFFYALVTLRENGPMSVVVHAFDHSGNQHVADRFEFEGEADLTQ
jgi:hypothetical protein